MMKRTTAAQTAPATPMTAHAHTGRIVDDDDEELDGGREEEEEPTVAANRPVLPEFPPILTPVDEEETLGWERKRGST